MVKIKRDHTEMIVTKGQFENLFKGLGFEIVNDKKDVKPNIVKEPTVKKTKGQK